MTTKHPEKGQRRVHVTPEVIEAWLVNGNRVGTDLPDDARLVSLWVAEEHWHYTLLFESAEWEALGEGELIPKTPVAIEVVDD